jgi:CxxC-x17-CxxC domain-containing protein
VVRSDSNDLGLQIVFTEQVIATQQTEFSDCLIKCIDCEKDFVWTSGEQVFFRDKGLQNPPKRCKCCKQAKNERIAAISAAQVAGVKQKIEVAVNCANCDSLTTVPFYPSQNRPVYCRSCFLSMNDKKTIEKS